MDVATYRVPAQLAADLADCLRRLRIARATNDEREEHILSLRLDWLIEKIPREKTC